MEHRPRRVILIRDQVQDRSQEVTCIVIEEDGAYSQDRRFIQDGNGEHEINGRRWRAATPWQPTMGTFDDMVALYMKEECWPPASYGPIRDISDAPNNLAPCGEG